jgi:D-hexose-6-phosphate mutarotase
MVEWEPIASGATANATTLTLRCPASREVPATAELTVVLADSLTLTLTTTNNGTVTTPISEALHTYFAVSDIRNVSVTGLDGQPYIDAVPAERVNRTQTGPITFTEEIDRIYTNTASECAILDPGMKRRILVSKEGSRSTVVWNPWIAKAARMPDYGDDEYPEMVCVETANCGPDALNLAPGQTHATTAHIRVAAL